MPYKVAPSVNPQQLVDLYIKVTEHIVNENATSKKKDLVNVLIDMDLGIGVGEALLLRLGFVEVLLTEHFEELARAGAVVKRSYGLLEINFVLFEHAADFDLLVDMDKPVNMRHRFNEDRCFAEIRAIINPDGVPPSFIITDNARPFRDDGTTATCLFKAFQPYPWSGFGFGTDVLNFDHLSYMPFSYAVDEWPDYLKFLKWRGAHLSKVPTGDRCVFSQDELKDDDPILNVAAHLILDAPPSLLHVLRIGPWSRFPRLIDSVGWDKHSYVSTALKSAVHAITPCERGELPLSIIGEVGTLQQLERCLELNPSAIDYIDLDGYMPHIRLITTKNRNYQLQFLLKAGADANFVLPTGHCCLLLALQFNNWIGALLILQYGYKTKDKPLIDKRCLKAAMMQKDCPEGLVAALMILYTDIPEDTVANERLLTTFSHLFSTLERIS